MPRRRSCDPRRHDAVTIETRGERRMSVATVVIPNGVETRDASSTPADVRARNRAIRVSAEMLVAAAAFAYREQYARYGGRGIVGASSPYLPPVERLTHADFVRALAAAGLTPAEDAIFRRCILPLDVAGQWLFRLDANGNRHIAAWSLCEFSRFYNVDEESVQRSLTRTVVKIRTALFGPDEYPLSDSHSSYDHEGSASMDRVSVKQYVAALKVVLPWLDENQIEMLRIQYTAPERIV